MSSAFPARFTQRPAFVPYAFFVSAICHYLGPSFAVLLFARVSVPGVAWMRVLTAAVVFGVWRRPWHDRRLASALSVRLFVVFGLVLAVMNLSFYSAIARLPLATVSAIEFLGPLALAALGAKSLRNVSALCLAASGVAAMSHVRLRPDPFGIACAFANCALFAMYIVIGHRIAQGPTGASRVNVLAASMFVAAAALAPVGIAPALPSFRDPVLLGAAIGVGVCSSVVPYVIDQFVMSSMARASFAMFISLLPAFATAIGTVVLRQIPTLSDLAGIGLVTIAIAVHRAESV